MRGPAVAGISSQQTPLAIIMMLSHVVLRVREDIILRSPGPSSVPIPLEALFAPAIDDIVAVLEHTPFALRVIRPTDHYWNAAGSATLEFLLASSSEGLRFGYPKLEVRALDVGEDAVCIR
jgi:hypothetical protein